MKTFYLSNMQQTETKIEMIIKMVNEYTRIQNHCPFCTLKPDADLCMRVDLPLDKKLWKIRTGPPGCGSLGLRAAAPSRAVGRGPAFSKTRSISPRSV